MITDRIPAVGVVDGVPEPGGVDNSELQVNAGLLKHKRYLCLQQRHLAQGYEI